MKDGNRIRAVVYVVGDNIDTDQMIPAEHLTLDPSIPEERLGLGAFALSGLPNPKKPFIEESGREDIVNGKAKARYNAIVAGRGFGEGSSREHAPVALGAAGVEVVAAVNYTRIFFENCTTTGEVLPVFTKGDITDKFDIGDLIEINLENKTIYNKSKEAEYPITLPEGNARAMIEAGGLFAYARKKGLIPERPEE